MAYMNQEKKKIIADALKAALKGENIKYTLSVRNHSTIVMTIKESRFDWIGQKRTVSEYITAETTHYNVNPYHYKAGLHGDELEVMTKIITALNTNNYDRSDIMTDYYECGHYVEILIGTYDKPYILTPS